MNIKEKIQSMKGSEILDAMITGLKNHSNLGVELDFVTFYDKKDEICYGCAATCTILNILNQKATETVFEELGTRNGTFDIPYFEDEELKKFVQVFELAINDLRTNNPSSYNLRAYEMGFAQLPNPEKIHLPWLDNEDWEDNIFMYEELRDELIAQEL